MWTVVATVMLHRGSQIAPGALIGNGAGVFAVGMTLLVAGAGVPLVIVLGARAVLHLHRPPRVLTGDSA